MRIIAGSRRGLILKTPKGDNTRPTLDRIKETLFNIIAPYIPQCSFLDIFSGSGGIGLEALSRGADKAVFIEKDKSAIEAIEYNLNNTKFDNATLMKQDYKIALNELNKKGEVFDVIFMDPPYDREIEKEALQILSSSSLINEDTLIIVEASITTTFDYLENMGLEIKKIKDYKNLLHVFIVRK